jgi:hypothetical protein
MPTVQALHLLPGRLRIQLSTIKNSPNNARRAMEAVGAIQGTISVHASPTTGSILVMFDSGLTSHGQILDCLSALPFFSRCQVAGRDKTLLSRLAASVGEQIAQRAILACLSL